MDDHIRTDEELRLCPTCRMAISAWATKCRYCGQTVGRPRKEEEKLTIRDLGGESACTYKVSGSVIDALESFRAEMAADHEAEVERSKPQGLRGRFSSNKGASSAKKKLDSDLPELDEEHQMLAQSVMGDSPSRFSQKNKQQQSATTMITRRLFTLASTVAILVLLGWGTLIAGAHVRDYLAKRNAGPQSDYRSLAKIMLDGGSPTIDAFKEAIKAANINDSEENLQLLSWVRTRLLGEVEGKLDAVPWNSNLQQEASALASAAFDVDSDPAIIKIYERVQKDMAAFKITLDKIEGTKATFTLRNKYYKDPKTGQPIQTETVDRDKVVGDRFTVSRINNDHVILTDNLVKNRTLRCDRSGVSPQK